MHSDEPSLPPTPPAEQQPLLPVDPLPLPLNTPGVPAAVVILSFIVVLTMYAVINQYEAIRFLGARSEWDFKMAAVLASAATAVCLWFNVTMGPLARADFPNLDTIDQA